MPILKLIANLSQALMPLLSFELLGFAAFMLAMIQNASMGFDNQDGSKNYDTSSETN